MCKKTTAFQGSPLFLVFAAFAFTLLLSPVKAVEPLFYVIGVAPDDVLNVRAEPSSTAEKITSLAPDAINIETTGKVQTVGDAEWREIRLEGHTGWVNAYYLHQMQVAEQQNPTLFRAPLMCSGTEPFWGLQVIDRQGELDSLSDGKTTIRFQSSREAGGVPIIWALRGKTTDTQSSVIAVIEETNSCSDGMSALLYQYSIRLDVADGPFFAGCCNRLPGQPDP